MSKEADELAEKLFNTFGLHLVLEKHIARYCKEKGIARSDLVEKFIENKFTPHQLLLHFCFLGYESFSRLCDVLIE